MDGEAMTQIDREWFIRTYDAFISEAGEDGVALEKSRDALATAYADAVESGADRWTPDLVSEGRALFNQFVAPERERRRTSVKKSWRSFLDALNGDTILGRDDPALAHAYPIGDGSDKKLFFWTPEDFQTAAMERFRNAAAATEAAAEFDREYSSVFITAMKRRSVPYFGALFA
jgi:hypothetical protein